MKNLPQTGDILLVRTHFSAPDAWDSLYGIVTHSNFRPRLTVVDEPSYRDATAERLVALPAGGDFLVVADEIALTAPGMPVSVLFRGAGGKGGLRVAVEELWTIENNTAQAAMVWGL
ncbi:DUF6924 domain-containing protein [Streptomyces seoulensis]